MPGGAVRDNRPLFVELFAGLHGWGEGAVAEGFRVVGFDIVDMCAANGSKRPDGIDLVIQDVLTIHGSQFRDAAVIVASPPCQKYSYLAMPWSRSKDPNNSKGAKALRLKWETEGPDNRLFDACFRIQREAIAATGEPCPNCGHLAMYTISTLCSRCNCTGRINTRHIPLVVENVRGAQPWVGRSAWNYGSFHLWGDVPALMPITIKVPPKRAMDDLKNGVRSAAFAHLPVGNGPHGRNNGTEGNKVPGFRFDGSGKSFQSASVEATGVKVPGQIHGTEYAMTRTGAHGQTVLGTRDGGRGVHLTSPAENEEGTKQPGGNGDWFSKEARAEGSSAKFGSKSSARKQASAQIAKIPLPLAQHIAAVYRPKVSAQVA